MSQPFVGEVKMVGFEFAPNGWAMCNGQLLPINQNQALFALLGTTYGGDGQTTFALPDLRGRIPFHRSNTLVQGQVAGEEQHTLITTEMPAHTHGVACNSGAGALTTPTNNYWAAAAQNPYAAAGTTAMSAQAVAPAGSGNAHENMPPFLVLNFIIALQGIFPSRN